MYKIENNKIIVKSKTFNPYSTLLCGQVFRYFENSDNIEIIAGDKYAKIYYKNDISTIVTDNTKFFTNYFDLDKNYDIIYSKLIDKGLLLSACEFSKGIHILNQDPIEVIFSFIISANNNILRIRKIINNICTELGEFKSNFYAFPTLKSLASQNEDFYKSMGAGYRASYLDNTAKLLYNNCTEFEKLQNLNTDELLKFLLTLKGIGPKVADCILLFAFHKMDVFPVDTWIRKVYNDYFGTSDSVKFIREDLIKRFGQLSGYAQQYLFYYKRELK